MSVFPSCYPTVVTQEPLVFLFPSELKALRLQSPFSMEEMESFYDFPLHLPAHICQKLSCFSKYLVINNNTWENLAVLKGQSDYINQAILKLVLYLEANMKQWKTEWKPSKEQFCYKKTPCTTWRPKNILQFMSRHLSPNYWLRPFLYITTLKIQAELFWRDKLTDH